MTASEKVLVLRRLFEDREQIPNVEVQVLAKLAKENQSALLHAMRKELVEVTYMDGPVGNRMPGPSLSSPNVGLKLTAAGMTALGRT